MVLADPRFLQNGHGAHDHSQSEYQWVTQLLCSFCLSVTTATYSEWDCNVPSYVPQCLMLTFGKFLHFHESWVCMHFIFASYAQGHCRLPEMSHGHAATACKADIHALGCLLVEMCTGEPWAAGVFTLNVFEPEADHAKSPLIHIMQRCLCVNADGRPPAAIVRKVNLTITMLTCLFGAINLMHNLCSLEPHAQVCSHKCWKSANNSSSWQYRICKHCKLQRTWRLNRWD